MVEKSVAGVMLICYVDVGMKHNYVTLLKIRVYRSTRFLTRPERAAASYGAVPETVHLFCACVKVMRLSLIHI